MSEFPKIPNQICPSRYFKVVVYRPDGGFQSEHNGEAVRESMLSCKEGPFYEIRIGAPMTLDCYAADEVAGANPPQVEIDGLRAEGKARPKLYQRLAEAIDEIDDIRETYGVYSDPDSADIGSALDSLGTTLYTALVDAVKLGK